MSPRGKEDPPPFVDLKDSGRIEFRGGGFIGPGRQSVRGERVEDITFDDVTHVDTGDGEERWFHRHPWWPGLILAGASAALALLLARAAERFRHR